MKRPWFKFYPDALLGEPTLRGVSLQALGLWFVMICLARSSEKPGYLVQNSRKIEADFLAKFTGNNVRTVQACMDELEESGTFSRDADGVIYCRRIVRDVEREMVGSLCGRKGGGNPAIKGRANGPLKDTIKPTLKEPYKGTYKGDGGEPIKAPFDDTYKLEAEAEAEAEADIPLSSPLGGQEEASVEPENPSTTSLSISVQKKEGAEKEVSVSAVERRRLELLAIKQILNSIFGRKKGWANEEEYWLTEHAVTMTEANRVAWWMRNAKKTEPDVKLPESILRIVRDWPAMMDRAGVWAKAHGSEPANTSAKKPFPEFPAIPSDFPDYLAFAGYEVTESFVLPPQFPLLPSDVQRGYVEWKKEKAVAV